MRMKKSEDVKRNTDNTMLKQLQEQTVEEKEFIFDFKTEKTVHRVITKE